MDRQPTLDGELVSIRPLQEADFPALIAIATDPLVWEQHPSKERSDPAVFRQFLEEGLATGGALAVVDRRSGEVIGTSRFDTARTGADEIEIGWTVLSRAYWGGPYNSETKRLMIHHAARWVNVVVFHVHSENFRSQRSVEKLGAVRVETETDLLGRGENFVYRLELRPIVAPDAPGGPAADLM